MVAPPRSCSGLPIHLLRPSLFPTLSALPHTTCTSPASWHLPHLSHPPPPPPPCLQEDMVASSASQLLRVLLSALRAECAAPTTAATAAATAATTAASATTTHAAGPGPAAPDAGAAADEGAAVMAWEDWWLPDLLQALYSGEVVVVVVGMDEWQGHVGKCQESGVTRQSRHIICSPFLPSINVFDKRPELSSWHLSAYPLHRNTSPRTPCHVHPTMYTLTCTPCHVHPVL